MSKWLSWCDVEIAYWLDPGWLLLFLSILFFIGQEIHENILQISSLSFLWIAIYSPFPAGHKGFWYLTDNSIVTSLVTIQSIIRKKKHEYTLRLLQGRCQLNELRTCRLNRIDSSHNNTQPKSAKYKFSEAITSCSYKWNQNKHLLSYASQESFRNKLHFSFSSLPFCQDKLIFTCTSQNHWEIILMSSSIRNIFWHWGSMIGCRIYSKPHLFQSSNDGRQRRSLWSHSPSHTFPCICNQTCYISINQILNG